MIALTVKDHTPTSSAMHAALDDIKGAKATSVMPESSRNLELNL